MASQLVIDTSCVVAILMNEPDAPAILRLTKGTELFSPESLPWEVGNSLSAVLRRKRIDAAQALAVYDLFLKLPIVLLDVSLRRSLELAAQLGIYAYDAYMICCSERAAAPLITLDSNLNAAARRAGVAVTEVAP